MVIFLCAIFFYIDMSNRLYLERPSKGMQHASIFCKGWGYA